MSLVLLPERGLVWLIGCATGGALAVCGGWLLASGMAAIGARLKSLGSCSLVLGSRTCDPCDCGDLTYPIVIHVATIVLWDG